MSTTAGLLVTLAIAWAVAIAMYAHAKGLRVADFKLWRGKKRVRVRWWEMPSPLLLGLRRQEKRMAQHKLTLSRDWRRSHQGDDAA